MSSPPTEGAQLELLRAQVPERLYRFAEHFLETLDANGAAELVGAPGKARDLLRDRRTGAVLRALQGEVAQAHQATREGALRQLLMLATFDPRDVRVALREVTTYDKMGNPGIKQEVDLSLLPDELAAAATIKIDDKGIAVTFDAKTRLAAIDRILQMCGDLPVAGSSGTAQVVFRGRSEEE